MYVRWTVKQANSLLGLLGGLLGGRSSVLSTVGGGTVLGLLGGDVLVVDTHGLVDLVTEGSLVVGTVI